MLSITAALNLDYTSASASQVVSEFLMSCLRDTRRSIAPLLLLCFILSVTVALILDYTSASVSPVPKKV